MDDSPPVSTFSGLLDGLTRIEEKLARIERRLDALERITDPNTTKLLTNMLALAEQAPNALAMLVDSIDQRVDELAGPLEIVSRVGRALSQAQQARPQPVGPFGLLRALSDHDVQRTLGLAISFTREFGRSLEPDQTPKALPKSSS